MFLEEKLHVVFTFRGYVRQQPGLSSHPEWFSRDEGTIGERGAAQAAAGAVLEPYDSVRLWTVLPGERRVNREVGAALSWMF